MSLWNVADGERPGRAAVPERAGVAAPRRAVGGSEELRGQVRRADVTAEEVHGPEQRAGGGQGAATGRAAQQKVTVSFFYPQLEEARGQIDSVSTCKFSQSLRLI